MIVSLIQDNIISLLASFLFFLAGVYAGKKTNIKIANLWSYNQLIKARKLKKCGEDEKALELYINFLKEVNDDWHLKHIDLLNLSQIFYKKRSSLESIDYYKKYYYRSNREDLGLKLNSLFLLMNNRFYKKALGLVEVGEVGETFKWKTLLFWIYTSNQLLEKSEQVLEEIKKHERYNKNLTIEHISLALGYSEIDLHRKARDIYKGIINSSLSNPNEITWSLTNLGYYCDYMGNKAAKNKRFRHNYRYKSFAKKFYQQSFDKMLEFNFHETDSEPIVIITNLISHENSKEKKQELIEFGKTVSPSSPLLMNHEARLLKDNNKSRRALEMAEEAYKMNANNESIINFLIGLYLDRCQYSRILKICSFYLKVNKPFWGYINGHIGIVLEKQGKYDEAVEQFKSSLMLGFSSETNYVYYYRKLINSLTKIRRHNEATLTCLEALSHFPSNTELKDLLAEVNFKSGDYRN